MIRFHDIQLPIITWTWARPKVNIQLCGRVSCYPLHLLVHWWGPVQLPEDLMLQDKLRPVSVSTSLSSKVSRPPLLLLLPLCDGTRNFGRDRVRGQGRGQKYDGTETGTKDWDQVWSGLGLGPGLVLGPEPWQRTWQRTWQGPVIRKKPTKMSLIFFLNLWLQ